MEVNRRSYDRISDLWGENRSKAPVNQCVVDFASRIKANGKVLDIGCGTGRPIAQYLAAQGFAVTGIDVSKNMLAKALALNLPKATFLLCDFFDYQPMEKYDGIVAFDSFFHFPLDRQAEIYRTVSAWMNNDAFLLFTHGNTEGEIEGTMYGETFYYSALGRAHVHALLLASGFAIVESIENYKEASTGERDLIVLAKKVGLSREG